VTTYRVIRLGLVPCAPDFRTDKRVIQGVHVWRRNDDA
jgi:hypothetical protein